MYRLLILLFCTLCGPALATCPVPSDMAKGVAVSTVGPRGAQTMHVFRKTAQGRVDERRTRRWIAARSTVERQLQRGLLPLEQRVIEAPEGRAGPMDEVYTYPGQAIARLQITPKTQITADAHVTASNGTRRKISTQYSIGAMAWRWYGRCRFRVMEITAVEDADGVETAYTYLYFERYGFAIETQAVQQGKTFETTILGIARATP
ncbi:hypothetical protein EI983_11390 [Roseovarius faecimaris]|uniref:Uncharacterized protein n=1 Tax=Roseovarius faecimaris TaxID=2494550 RepID=A0A6I6IRI9_9RHOB|nr:hypothetical protein [Roseovarius faecimaris]QGX98842.1 hypothetical protein EI983_11390 [Roseovarius faecimaris]